jgi:hypothetical protein
MAGPAEHHGPADGTAVRAAEAEGMEPGEDADAADEGMLALGELGSEELVEARCFSGASAVWRARSRA